MKRVSSNQTLPSNDTELLVSSQAVNAEDAPPKAKRRRLLLDQTDFAKNYRSTEINIQFLNLVDKILKH